jgi:type II secretory pathway pseudopilin PulG
MAGRTVAKMEGGFTIVELIVTIAIAVVLLALSVPAVTVWLPNYYLRNAAMDIFSNMQFAKTEAIRANSNYALVFDPGNGTYSLVSNPGGDGIFGQGGDDVVENTVRVFDYGPNIAYGHTPATKNFEDGSGTFPGDEVSYNASTGYLDNVVVFDGRGMCNAGSIYLQNNKNRTYAVGTLMSGVLRIARWGGGDWQ